MLYISNVFLLPLFFEFNLIDMAANFPHIKGVMLKLAGLFLLLVICIWLLLRSIGGKIGDADTKMKEQVNKSVLVDGDTLKVVNYSIVSNSYTLSNGLEVDLQYIEQNEVTKHLEKEIENEQETIRTGASDSAQD